GMSPPEVVARVAIEQPQDAGEKALAPVSPALTFAIPLSACGVHRSVAGIRVEDAPGLNSGEIQSSGQRLLRDRHGRVQWGEVQGIGSLYWPEARDLLR